LQSPSTSAYDAMSSNQQTGQAGVECNCWRYSKCCRENYNRLSRVKLRES